jgi:hypothetical protein
MVVWTFLLTTGPYFLSLSLFSSFSLFFYFMFFFSFSTLILFGLTFHADGSIILCGGGGRVSIFAYAYDPDTLYLWIFYYSFLLFYFFVFFNFILFVFSFLFFLLFISIFYVIYFFPFYLMLNHTRRHEFSGL